MKDLADKSVDLIMTSPPYPMIEMWDDLFSAQSPEVKKRLSREDGPGAFEAMHKILDAVWTESYRVLKPGGFACINIGDATRTLKHNFALYTNHARILKFAQVLGFSALPCILWRKQTNAPNKFMGSGMMPAGAYVTLEHEYILILRKGGKREFTKEALKKNRRSSAFFWEERNLWFSDVWFDIKGTVQATADKDTRKRSAAYPFELAYRLINMYSAKGDLVLDPYLGMGTTTSAAMASGRNSMGYEIDPTLEAVNLRAKEGIIHTAQKVIRQRLVNHLDFVAQRTKSKGRLKHENIPYGFPVMTAQEKELLINQPLEVQSTGKHIFVVEYASTAQAEFCTNGSNMVRDDGEKFTLDALKDRVIRRDFKQKSLF
jgi:DNA modification methylase